MSGRKIHQTFLKARQNIFIFPLILIILSLSCALPFSGSQTATPPSSTHPPTQPPAFPTPTPQPLPPALVESNPPLGAEFPSDGSITLFFNQPMDHASVESALTSDLSRNINADWLDSSTLIISPITALESKTNFSIHISTSARSTSGMELLEPIKLDFKTAGYLHLTQTLPEPDTIDVDPSSAIVTAFNQPVVPLGAEPETLPEAFTVKPGNQGYGEWINTSTYIFYPEPPLGGGQTYTVIMNEELRGSAGSPLEDAVPWSFTTAQPRLVSIEPETEIPLRLDDEFVFTFNQPMDTLSVRANFNLTAPDGTPVSGEIDWNEDTTVFTFTPARNLLRDTEYVVLLDGQAQARGGTPLGETFQANIATVPQLAIHQTDPLHGGTKDPRGSVVLHFTSPIQEDSVLEHITTSPEVPNLESWWSEGELALRLYGNFAPSTSYTLNVSPDLPDIWGGTMEGEFQLAFTTNPLPPGILVSSSSGALFITPQDNSLTVQATNLSELPVSLGSVGMDDFFTMFAENGYEFKRSYKSPDQTSWTQTLDLAPDQSQTVDLYLSPNQDSLSPGLYYLRLDLPHENIYKGPFLLVSSNIQLTFKLSATDALVWAVDLRTDKPLTDAPITIYGEGGSILASGKTDSHGVFRTDIPTLDNPYRTAFAVIGKPGEDNFSMALSTWDSGLASWDFDLTSDYSAPGLKAYIYTDRPIYRPGQTVFFRAIVREAYNGRYQLPDLDYLPLTISGFDGDILKTLELPLSGFGTAHGEYNLPANAQPGHYNIHSEAVPDSYLNFQVANYRKPEINLQVDFTSDQALSGEDLKASINARYFFDAPAGNVPLHWELYAAPSYLNIPGYQVGVANTTWLYYHPIGFTENPLGELVSEGEAQTKPDGTLDLVLATEASETRQRYTLEVTLEDESGLPVSARDSAEMNPAEYYIGVQPDSWIGHAGKPMGFEIQIVDWDRQPAGSVKLGAKFSKVVWSREDPLEDDPYQAPKFVPHYTKIESTDITTDSDGTAHLSFSPSEPGTYQLDVFSREAGNEGARTEVLLWVAGPGGAIWPEIPNSRLRLTSDQDSYLPGESARVFIPNPFDTDVLALVTVERGTVLSHQVTTIEPGGGETAFELDSNEAPNVYISTTLLGRDTDGNPDFRQGYINLPVEPVNLTLDVALTSQPERTGPGEDVTFDVTVTDASGEPVEGEFSLAVVDSAVLALADPNAPDIMPAFYAKQPIGVRTGLSLAAYTRRLTSFPDGLGGGGGGGLEALAVTRQHFPDTAYWNAELTTGPDGSASVTLPLPDTLTTWQVDLRGTTADTLVGGTQTKVLTTKDLLVRPVTPRFLVEGDHNQLAAIVQNNTHSTMQVEVSLQADGFTLDDPDLASQKIRVPAGGRSRVEWWGTTNDIESVDLVFSALGLDADSGQLFYDASRPALGDVPILRYTARQTFRTAGTQDAAGERLELVSLPRSFDPGNGRLSLELSPSLAAGMVDGLDVLEHYPYECNEQTLSRFLPNLETFRLMQQFGLEADGLEDRLDRTLNDGMQKLSENQNSDGGWGWWSGGSSDTTITAYILFGLSRLKEAGIKVDEAAIEGATRFLQTEINTLRPSRLSSLENWQLDHLVFAHFALSQAGAGDLEAGMSLYQVEDQLNPWAQALLALSLETLSPGSPEAKNLISNLESTAIRSAAGAHWETDKGQSSSYTFGQSMKSTQTNSAIVTYALAQREPGSPLLDDAVRYLMSTRTSDGGWESTYATAWTLMALVEVIKGTGELVGDYTFSAALNDIPIASGTADGLDQLTPVIAEVPISDLYPDYPNALKIERGPGQGKLYYLATLDVSHPVESVNPLSQGMSISRSFYPADDEACHDGGCEPIQKAPTGERVTVRVTLTLPNDAYYLLVEDYIPAGAEILDPRLKTSQLGEGDAPIAEVKFDSQHPFDSGWGWWYFNDAQIYDDHISWASDYLPAGTYELTYTIATFQPGEYRVLPARGWQFYFPEVQANSAGTVFEITP